MECDIIYTGCDCSLNLRMVQWKDVEMESGKVIVTSLVSLEELSSVLSPLSGLTLDCLQPHNMEEMAV